MVSTRRYSAVRLALFRTIIIGLSACAAAPTPAQTQPQTQPASPPLAPLRHFAPADREAQQSFEREISALPAAASLRAWHGMLASEPHMAGTEGDARLIAQLADAFKAMGLEVQVHEFWPYLSTPIDARLEIIAPEALVLPVKEQALPEDEISGRGDLTIGFNAYSGSGDVTGEVVYANYGTKADFEKLKELGIDCTGKIVIARYGGNFRGFKARFAQEAGAAGLIIYTDPEDSGYGQGVPYPEGGWANDSQIQRGSLLTLDYPGDPLTPDTPALKDAQRVDPADVDFPRIPVQPIGYGPAGEIFKRMKGRALPRDLVKSWQGGLPCAYRLEGGPDLKVRLMVKQDRAIAKTANVIATLRGTEFPNQKIIIGCHHDAWVCGAGDPAAGTMLVMEAARSFSEMAKNGRRPKRTILFCAWGAEEFGIIGSTEFCEQYRTDLSYNAVAYVNLDAAAMGAKFGSSAAPALKTLIEEVVRDVPQCASPARQSVHQAWLGDSKQARFGNLGGGSDHVGFYCRLGIPSCAFGTEGASGTAYHSIYDTLDWYRKIVGDDYEPAVMLTRIVNLFAARMANATVLPLDPARLADDMPEHLETLRTRATDLKQAVDFADMAQAVDDFGIAARKVNEMVSATLEAEPAPAIDWYWVSGTIRMVCCRPMSNDGLPERPWFKNLFAASDPDSGYAAWILPALRWSIEQGDAESLRQTQAELLAEVEAMKDALHEIGVRLRPQASRD